MWKKKSNNIISTSSKDYFKNSIMLTPSRSHSHIHKIASLSSENDYPWMKKIHMVRMIGIIV
jgi:hypothetical protein